MNVPKLIQNDILRPYPTYKQVVDHSLPTFRSC